MKYNTVGKVQEHYDFASPYYQKLWGSHIHHGYWITGKESKEEAQENLIKLLVEHSGINDKSRLLDVGCGVGGTSNWLAKNKHCDVVGITISPVQVEMATQNAKDIKSTARFLVDDANNLSVKGNFDSVWAIEMISHLQNRADLFKKINNLLVSGGKIVITDWLKDDHISTTSQERYIHPIEQGMLVDLPNFSEYKKHIDDNQLRLVYYEDISSKVLKTWDISIGLVKKPALWKMAATQGAELVSFLKSFQDMRAGFKTGTFRYCAMVIEKP